MRDAPTVSYSATTRAAMGKTWQFLIATGKYDPWLEFHSGPMVRSPEDPATAQNKLLCRLKVDPLTLRVAEGNAINSGLQNAAGLYAYGAGGGFGRSRGGSGGMGFYGQNLYLGA